MKKRIVILLIGMFLCQLNHVKAQTSEKYGVCGKNLHWLFSEKDSNLIISGYGPMTEYESEFDTPWREYNQSIRTIDLPDGLISIGSNAFSLCVNLKQINIPYSVTNIGKSAFADCRLLCNLNIPANVQFIGENAFVRIPNIKYLGAAKGKPWGAYCINGYTEGALVFSDSTKTQLVACNPNYQGNVTIPTSVLIIKEGSFQGCDKVINISIPKSVKLIENYVFSCTSLESIQVDSLNAYYCSIGGILFNADTTILIKYPEAKKNTKYTIPISVISINEYAFSFCESLEEVICHNSIQKINKKAFIGCKKLKRMNLPININTIEEGTFEWCYSLNDVVIPNKVSAICERAFCECYALSNLVIGEGTMEIGVGAFSGCLALKTINIPNSVCIIRRRAFDGCPLVSLEIGSGIKQIESEAIGSCERRCIIKCKAVQPPSTNSNAFSLCEYKHPTIYVPEKCIEDYKKTNPWNLFDILPF